MGKINLAWANSFLAWVNSFVHGQNRFSMGKIICTWSTRLAHGQIHFCAHTFFVWSIIITLNAHAKMKTLINEFRSDSFCSAACTYVRMDRNTKTPLRTICTTLLLLLATPYLREHTAWSWAMDKFVILIEIQSWVTVHMYLFQSYCLHPKN